MRIIQFLISLVVCVGAPAGAVADASLPSEETEALPSEPPPNEASDASFDQRLPPVLPGEEINDSGRKTRVWSTSGPVPVAPAPEPWRKRSIGDIDVIVDQRPHRRDGRH